MNDTTATASSGNRSRPNTVRERRCYLTPVQGRRIAASLRLEHAQHTLSKAIAEYAEAHRRT